MILTASSFSSAQETKEAKKNSPEQGKFYIVPLPAFGYNPVMGILYGAAVSGNFLSGPATTTRLSSVFFNALYTTNKQLHLALRSTVFTQRDRFVLNGDWRYLLSSQPTYGLGTGPQSEILVTEKRGTFKLGDYRVGVDISELMEYDLLRLYETAFYQVKKGVYLGVGYHYDRYSNINDRLLNLDTIPARVTNHYAYSTIHGFDPTGYTTSGPSANFMYDTRDNINNPYKGRYAFAQVRYNPAWLGSDTNSALLLLEYRDYFSVSKQVERNLIAIWAYMNITIAGRLPYMALPALGWDQMGRTGRAFPQGRFRGEGMFYFESEYRFRIPIFKQFPDFVGGVVFANLTSASATDLDVQLFNYLQPGAGIGLRFMFQEATRTNITMDYGIGADGKGAFYFNIKEYF